MHFGPRLVAISARRVGWFLLELVFGEVLCRLRIGRVSWSRKGTAHAHERPACGAPMRLRSIGGRGDLYFRCRSIGCLAEARASQGRRVGGPIAQVGRTLVQVRGLRADFGRPPLNSCAHACSCACACSFPHKGDRIKVQVDAHVHARMHASAAGPGLQAAARQARDRARERRLHMRMGRRRDGWQPLRFLGAARRTQAAWRAGGTDGAERGRRVQQRLVRRTSV